MEILNQFKFGHLRAEIKLIEKNWKIEFVKSVAESNHLQIPLFLVVYFSGKYEKELELLTNTISKLDVKVKYLVVLVSCHV